MAKRFRQEREFKIPQGYIFPDSLQYFFTNREDRPESTWELHSEQLFDLALLPQREWDFMWSWYGRSNPQFDHFLATGKGLREMDSTEKVREYLNAELVLNNDPYHQLGKIQLPGAGVDHFYKNLVRVAKIETLGEERRAEALQRLSYWEEAALEIICDENVYFTPTKNGTEGTLSEFLGTMTLSGVRISTSPNRLDGRYAQQLLEALDFQGIIDGTYSRSDFNLFQRQEAILSLFHACQGAALVDREFWASIEKNESFIFVSHEVAVQEGFENAEELLVKGILYSRRLEREMGFHFPMAARNMFGEHFGDEKVEGRKDLFRFLTGNEHDALDDDEYEQVFREFITRFKESLDDDSFADAEDIELR